MPPGRAVVPVPVPVVPVVPVPVPVALSAVGVSVAGLSGVVVVSDRISAMFQVLSKSFALQESGADRCCGFGQRQPESVRGAGAGKEDGEVMGLLVAAEGRVVGGGA